MKQSEIVGQKTIIAEIKKKIRLINAVGGFIIITLLAVIMRYLFEPFSELFNFLPDVSISLIIMIIIVLTLIGFYIWTMASRDIIRRIEAYQNSLESVLTTTKDLREEVFTDIILEKILNYSLSISLSDAGSIFLVQDENIIFKAVKGEKTDELRGKVIPKGIGIAGWVAEKGEPVHLSDITKDERFNPEIDQTTGYETKSILCVPLMMKSKVIGVMELLNKKEGFYSTQDMELITYFADQAAISLTRAQFYEDQKNYEIHVTDILLETLETQIPEKMGHSRRVASYSNIMAKAMNMSDEEQKRLYFACLLHDVGFLKIRFENSDKRVYYTEHPVIGYKMISPINFYQDIAPFILYHHERYDGQGYPKGLQGDAIPVESRIIAIAEAFDAMINESSYKKPLGFDAALEELKRNAGTQFDFWLVEIFVTNISPEYLH